VSRRRELSSIVAVTTPLAGAPARLCARHFEGTIHAREVLATLRYVRRRLARPLLVVWDHLNAHRARVVRDFAAGRPQDFTLAWLPAYAPELNPEEQCNQWVKHGLLNATPESVEELHRQVRGRFVRLAHRPELLQNFFAHAGLDVN
jgi:transposase